MIEIIPTFECPCCGYISLKGGDLGEICPICYWEYDVEVGFRGTIPSVVNSGLTLLDARYNFDKYGACEESMIKYVLPAEARGEYLHSSDSKQKI